MPKIKCSRLWIALMGLPLLLGGCIKTIKEVAQDKEKQCWPARQRQ